MAFVFKQSVQAATGGATSLAITVTATTANSVIIVNSKLGGIANTITSVTDNKGNTYALAAGPSVGGTNLFSGFQHYGVQLISGATTVTINFNGTVSARIIAEEFTGGQITNASVFDKSAINNGNGTAASVTLAPTNSGELISAGVCFTGAGSITHGTGYTMGTTQTNQSSEYRLSGTISETTSMSWSPALDWAECAGAYIPATASLSNFNIALV